MQGAQTEPPITWQQVGDSVAADFFVEPLDRRVLYIWPRLGVTEDEAGARENKAFVERWMRQHGRWVVLVFVDRAGGQTRDARRVHSNADPELLAGMAFVGMTPLSRALAAFAIGLLRSPVPLKLFGNPREARDWALSRLDASPEGALGS